MPAKRLPWYKVWVGTSRHAKVVGLSDRSFRIWHELLDAASEQKVRGRFDSLETAARVIRRSVRELQPLLRAGLLDQADDGLWLHDWKDWQRWRPEDAMNDDGFPPDDPPKDTRSTHDQHTNVNGTTHEEHANVNGITTDQHAKNYGTTHEDPSRGAERAKTETETEKKDGELTPVASQQPPGAEEAFSTDDRERIDAANAVLAPIGLDAPPRFWRKVLDNFGQLDLEAEALGMADWLRRHRKRVCSTAFVLNWLKASAERQPTKVVALNDRRAAMEAEFGWMAKSS